MLRLRRRDVLILAVAATLATPAAVHGGANKTASASVLTPDLAITKTASVGPAVNQIQYTITLSNIGNGDATRAAFFDNKPFNTTFINLTQTSGPIFDCITYHGCPFGGVCTSDPGDPVDSVVCEVPTLIAGNSATFNLAFLVTPGTPAGTPITNTAFTGSSGDTNLANNVASATTFAPSGIPTLSPVLLALLGGALAFAAFSALER